MDMLHTVPTLIITTDTTTLLFIVFISLYLMIFLFGIYSVKIEDTVFSEIKIIEEEPGVFVYRYT